jgi:hypothetical protein
VQWENEKNAMSVCMTLRVPQCDDGSALVCQLPPFPHVYGVSVMGTCHYSVPALIQSIKLSVMLEDCGLVQKEI